MYDYVRRFGFGQKTGIPLPGESKGRLRGLPQWGSTSLASVSMGQEISVTTLQLAQRGIGGGQRRLAGEAPAGAETGRSGTAPGAAGARDQARNRHHHAADDGRRGACGGTGKRARLDGYTSGGKTGSAQIYDFAGRTLHPRLQRLVHGICAGDQSGDGGSGDAEWHPWARRASAGKPPRPVFHAVATEALRLLDVPKDLPDDPPAGRPWSRKTMMPNDLAIADLGSGQPNILEDRDDEEPRRGPCRPSLGR